MLLVSCNKNNEPDFADEYKNNESDFADEYKKYGEIWGNMGGTYASLGSCK